MKNLLLILFVFLIGSTVIAGNSDPLKSRTKIITGKITDTTGETLAGVQITVTETGENFFADMEGNFKITLPADKVYTLKVNTTGYQPLHVLSNELGTFSDLSLQAL